MMIRSWLNRRRQGLADRASNGGISDPAWQALLMDYPFARAVGGRRLPALRAAVEGFLQAKTFAGAGGFTVDDQVGAAIALQACIPVVELGLRWYDDFEQIIVYPGEFRVRRAEQDAIGVVHEEDAVLAGESLHRGPVVLSWEAAAPDDDPWRWNVVIHEFAHKLDLRDGESDGIPPMPAARRRAWASALAEALRRFRRSLAKVERAMPSYIDPDGEAADRYYARLPLDPYAAADETEFFAVCAEAFFLTPDLIREAFPEFHAELVTFFRFEPLASDTASDPSRG